MLNQPENEKVYSLGLINDPSKEVKVWFMRKSGQCFLLSKKLEKWFPKSAIFHRCSIPSIDNHLRYSFDAIEPYFSQAFLAFCEWGGG